MGDYICINDLWRTLVHRKALIFAIFSLSVILAVSIGLLIKPVYESQAVFKIGTVGTQGEIEEPSEIVIRIQAGLELDAHDQAGKKSRSAFVEVRSDNNIIYLKSQGENAEGAKNQLMGITNGLLERHRVLFEDAKKRKETRLHEVKADINNLQTQADFLSSLIEEWKKNYSGIIGLSIERSKLYQTLVTLKSQKENIETSLSEAKTYPTHLIHGPTLPKNPVKPKPIRWYLVLGGVFGLLVGIIAAFFTEFLSDFQRASGTLGSPQVNS